MKKLVLINPVNPSRTGLSINKSSRFPPLGLGIIAALTPDDWDIEIIDENFDEFEYAEADLAGITAFTASVNRAYEICGIYRKRKIPVIMGGIHVSLNPEEAAQFADSIVIGEAETVWAGVIQDFESGGLKKIYKSEGIDLAEVPAARHDLFHKGYMFGSIQTARGCPLDCDFCSVTVFNGNKYRSRPVENVLDEIEKIPQKMMFIIDDNIIGYGRNASQRALSLFRGMVERGLKKEWFCQASMNFTDDEEVLKWAAKSGCRMVFIGLESDNTEALKEANKSLNIKMGIQSYDAAVEKINRFGIAVLGAFIYGFDADDTGSLAERTRFIINSSVDVIQATYLTPLPGTRLFEKMRRDNRLLYNNFPEDWKYYDMTEAVFKPEKMSPQELEFCMRRHDASVRKIIGRKFIKTLISTRSFNTAMWALSSNLNYQNVSKIKAGNPYL